MIVHQQNANGLGGAWLGWRRFVLGLDLHSQIARP
jgi:hypothetical protein